MKIDIALLPWPCAIADDGGALSYANSLWHTRFGAADDLKECLPAALELLRNAAHSGTHSGTSGQNNHSSFDAVVRAPGESAPLMVRFARSEENVWLLIVDEARSGEMGAPSLAQLAQLEEHDLERELSGVAMRLQARNWRAFFRDAAAGKALIHLTGETLEVNKALCELTGYSENELLHLHSRDIRHSDDRARVEENYQSILDGGPPVAGIESRYRHKKGHYLSCLLSLTLIRDSRDRPLYFTAEIEDITSRRAAEAQLREQTRQLERSNLELTRSNAELERFAFVASHDLQEPLRKIRVFGDRLRSCVSPDSSESFCSEADMVRYVDGMMRSAERMQSLIEGLLAYGRLQDRSTLLEPVDLNALWDELRDEFEDMLRESGARIQVGELPVVNGNALRLMQLFANLLSNALKFRGEKPPLVSVSALPHPDPAYLSIEVRDNGIGFGEADTEAIFKVFTRLHGRSTYPGTGIGLAICRRVAREHGGDVRAFASPTPGARFVVTLLK